MNLTPTDRRIMACMMEGQVHKEIAASLNMAVRTVKFHAARIYAKHGVATREELIRLKNSGGSKFEWDKLSEQEKRICKLSVDHTHKQIAEALDISPSTVRVRLANGIVLIVREADWKAFLERLENELFRS